MNRHTGFFNRTNGAIAAGTAVAALNLMPSPQPDPEADALRQQAAAIQEAKLAEARMAVATRYAGCVITRVFHDPRQHKAVDSPRQTLTLSFRLTQTPESALARRTPENSAFGWEPPKIIGHLLANGQVANRWLYIKPKDFNNFDGRNEQPTKTFEPHVYPEGTEAAFFASSSAHTSDGTHTTTTTGEVPCGTLKVKGGIWTPEQPLGEPASAGTGPQIPPYVTTEVQ